MNANKRDIKAIILPVAGIIAFIILYVVSTTLYPGGTNDDPYTRGFSWKHNYWCELMAFEAKNGEANAASTIAITAMIVLAFSISACWYYAPVLFINKNKGRWLVTYPGILSMALLFLFFTGEHDKTINISGALGVLAMTATLVAIYRRRQYFLFWLGIVCLVLCVLNNYIYYSTRWFYYLPVIQKITFIAFLWWFIWLSWLQYMLTAKARRAQGK